MEPGKLGALWNLWGLPLEDSSQGNQGLGPEVQARLWQQVGPLERTTKLEEPSPSQDQHLTVRAEIQSCAGEKKTLSWI